MEDTGPGGLEIYATFEEGGGLRPRGPTAPAGGQGLEGGGMESPGPGGLEISATFEEVGGLRPRAPIAIAGVKVGQVSEIRLDGELRARVTLDLDPSLQLPVDSSARIVTSGLLGDQFITLEPGAEEDMLVSN